MLPNRPRPGTTRQTSPYSINSDRKRSDTRSPLGTALILFQNVPRPSAANPSTTPSPAIIRACDWPWTCPWPREKWNSIQAQTRATTAMPAKDNPAMVGHADETRSPSPSHDRRKVDLACLAKASSEALWTLSLRMPAYITTLDIFIFPKEHRNNYNMPPCMAKAPNVARSAATDFLARESKDCQDTSCRDLELDWTSPTT
jgi:hypothetical protein